MDPDEALRNVRDAVAAYQQAPNRKDAVHAADNIVDAFLSLDGWLCGGGYPPQAWMHGMSGPREMHDDLWRSITQPEIDNIINDE